MMFILSFFEQKNEANRFSCLAGGRELKEVKREGNDGLVFAHFMIDRPDCDNRKIGVFVV